MLISKVSRCVSPIGALKWQFLVTFLSRLFEDWGPTLSVCVLTLKDLALIVCCQSNITFSKLWKSILKLVTFPKSILNNVKP